MPETRPASVGPETAATRHPVSADRREIAYSALLDIDHPFTVPASLDLALLNRDFWEAMLGSARFELSTFTPLTDSLDGLRSAMGYEDAFPRPRLRARCRFSQGTFAGILGNGRDAPKNEPARA